MKALRIISGTISTIMMISMCVCMVVMCSVIINKTMEIIEEDNELRQHLVEAKTPRQINRPDHELKEKNVTSLSIEEPTNLGMMPASVSTMMATSPRIEDPNSISIEEVEKLSKSETAYETPKETNGTTYTIKSGDSWYRISERVYYTGEYAETLRQYNEGKYENFWAGETIVIPSLEDETFMNLHNSINESKTDEAVKFMDSMKGKTIKAGPSTEFRYGVRTNPAVDINVPDSDNMKNYTGEVDTSKYILYDKCFVTGYTPTCVHCCNSAEGITASGSRAICGYTVATHANLPFGTTLYIEGYGYYQVEDRGALKSNTIDIASPNHEACGPVTAYNVNVYIVPNLNK